MNGILYCQATGNACIHLSSTAKQDSWEQKLHLKRPALPHSYLRYLVDSMVSSAPPSQQTVTEMSANCDECSEGF